MTAEIAILNTYGVALASDSAVTLEIQSRQSTEKKIYNSSNKLFALSKFHPVGIMVYGNAAFLGLPWETIIKNYRSQIWKREFDKLSDYVEDFRKYLEHVLPSEEQQGYFEKNISSYFSMICEEIKDEVKKDTTNGAKVSLIDVKRIINISIKKQLEEMKTRATLPGMPENFDKRIINNRESVIDTIIKDIFIKLPISKGNRKSLFEIAGFLFIKDIFPNNCSGIVIAGYGKMDNFPAIVEMKIDGVIDDIVKYNVEQEEYVSFQSGAIICPFAQKEMVCTFMEGVDPNYGNMVNGVLSDLLEKYPKILLDNISQIENNEKDKILQALLKTSKKIKDDIIKEFYEFRLNTFISPVLGAVGALPKDELAVMAETLVNLTSFKRKMSLDAETVGGPIDVAVISKGDGFVWIKRKHYFKAELNHQFFKNYYIRAEDEEES
jgi:hypothetical protein